MSHELRTPLNSLLILSDQLSQEPGRQPDRRSRSSSRKTIHASGNDLLTLINDILDLSKIESGTVVVDVGEVRLRRSAATTSSAPSATSPRPRASTSSIELDPRAAASMLHRREAAAAGHQEPAVERVQVHAPGPGHAARSRRSTAAGSPDNEELEPRADGDRVLGDATPASASRPTSSRSSSRRSSRPTAARAASTAAPAWAWRSAARSSRLLGGEIRLVSTPGTGSTFTLYLPQTYTPPRRARCRAAPAPSHGSQRRSRCTATRAQRRTPAAIARRDAIAGRAEPSLDVASSTRSATTATSIQPGDRVLLIVENDLAFAALPARRGARERASRASSRRTGAAALALAREFQPDADHARHLPARHRRLARARPAEGRPRDAAHPGLRRSRPTRRASARCSRARSASCQAVQPRRTLDALLDRAQRLRRRGRASTLLVVDRRRRRRATQFVAVARRRRRRGRRRSPRRRGRGAMRRAQRVDCLVRRRRRCRPAARRAGRRVRRSSTVDCAAAADRRLRRRHGRERARRAGERSRKRIARARGALARAAARRRRASSCTADRRDCRTTKRADARASCIRRDQVLQGKKVLIVDDDMRNIFALTSVLERSGHGHRLGRQRPRRDRRARRRSPTSTSC